MCTAERKKKAVVLAGRIHPQSISLWLPELSPWANTYGLHSQVKFLKLQTPLPFIDQVTSVILTEEEDLPRQGATTHLPFSPEASAAHMVSGHWNST